MAIGDAFPDRVAQCLRALQREHSNSWTCHPSANLTALTLFNRCSTATLMWSSWPRHRVSPAALRSRGRSRQARVHGKAGGSGSRRSAPRAWPLARRQPSQPGGRRRAAAAPLNRVYRETMTDFTMVPSATSWHCASTGTASGVWVRPRQPEHDRNGVPDAQLVLLQLAVRRPHREQHIHNLDVGNWLKTAAIPCKPRPWAAAKSATARNTADFRPPFRRVHLRRWLEDVQPKPAHSQLLE